MDGTIYDFITEQETAYSKPIELIEGWKWNMKDHIRRSFLYKNSQFEEHNEDRDLRPFKNIVRPIVNTEYRTEGFDVKDIELYVDDPDNYYKSFLVRKFHDKWAVENEIDTFIDEVVESYVDYGGALVKDVDDKRPEVIDLGSLAFCSQVDILAHPFAIKHEMSPSQLRDMKKWGKDENGATIDIESFIALTKDEPKRKIYELHGEVPERWLNGGESKEDTLQVQIVAFYRKSDGVEEGVTLFKRERPKLPFKFLKRDPIYGRALGFGGIEELFEPQVWTSWSESKITEMLDQASKTLYKSTDHTFKTRNNLSKVEMGEVLTLTEGKDITQLDTTPRNTPVFNDAVVRWEEHAGKVGHVSEGLLGQPPTSGTPFKSLEAQIVEGKGMHHYRQGKIAVFVDEVYRDWVLPHLVKELVKEQKFLTELSADEMMELSETIMNNEANRRIKEQILNGELPDMEQMETTKEATKAGFLTSPKKFVKILEGEMKDLAFGISTNIAGKQKNLALLTDKIVNVLRQFIATPEIRQDPQMVKLLNTILESSGMSPMIFGPGKALPAQQQQGGGSTEPLKTLGEAVKEPAQTL